MKKEGVFLCKVGLVSEEVNLSYGTIYIGVLENDYYFSIDDKNKKFVIANVTGNNSFTYDSGRFLILESR